LNKCLTEGEITKRKNAGASAPIARKEGANGFPHTELYSNWGNIFGEGMGVRRKDPKEHKGKAGRCLVF